MITLGLIINPYAGIGGAVGLKGSDGPATVSEAFARGAQQRSTARARAALEVLLPYRDRCRFITCPKDMGENLLIELGFDYDVLAFSVSDPSTAEDTTHAATLLLAQRPDVVVFAGGDGTARDICAVLGSKVPVLGIPAGVKIHSAVYGITPQASGEVLARLICGQLVDIRDAEVRDLDEEAFRNDQVRSRHYGEMRVPQVGHFVQAVKQGGVESEEMVVEDIAAYTLREMEEDVLYFIGSGKTTKAIMDALQLEHTLLGVDAIVNQQLIGKDLGEQQISELLQQYGSAKAIISVMGGQGHIIGRGNQQFSADVLRKIGKDNIQVISTKTKISALA
ncbi:MAG: ATP-NAD kinase family protein, partial [Oleibacter sp.]|nr:ATP-NAD kinase family protein [Thalassolituus sp.]